MNNLLIQNTLVVNRLTIGMGAALTEQLCEIFNADRSAGIDTSSRTIAELQQKITVALMTQNPESCCRPVIQWTDCGTMTISCKFIISSSADDEVLNSLEDHDYLNHLYTIQRVAKANGFEIISVSKLAANFPFDKTSIPRVLD